MFLITLVQFMHASCIHKPFSVSFILNSVLNVTNCNQSPYVSNFQPWPSLGTLNPRRNEFSHYWPFMFSSERTDTFLWWVEKTHLARILLCCPKRDMLPFTEAIAPIAMIRTQRVMNKIRSQCQELICDAGRGGSYRGLHGKGRYNMRYSDGWLALHESITRQKIQPPCFLFFLFPL